MSAPSVPARRILVDCSLIAPHPAPTGIPRVVMQYVTHGAVAAARLGLDFALVEAGPEGFHACETVSATLTADIQPAKKLPLKVVMETARYASRLGAAGARMISALVPARPVRAAMGAMEAACLDLVPRLRRWEASRRPFGPRVALGAGDILFCPGYWHDTDADLYAAARAAGADVVFLVHDIMPVTLPTHYQYPWRAAFEQRVTRAFEVVSHFYCISRRTRSELIAHAAWQGHALSSSVAYNGFTPPAAAGEGPPQNVPPDLTALLTRRPWLMVGTLEPKKGHADVLAVFHHLWRAGYERPLLLIGRRGWMSEALREEIADSPQRERLLFWREGLEDDAVQAAYHAGHGLIVASEAEGFGLPVLEGVAHRLPVIARDIPAVREIFAGLAEAPDFLFADRLQLREQIRALEDARRRDDVLRIQGTLKWYRWPDVVNAVFADAARSPQPRMQGDDLLLGVAKFPVLS